MSEALRADDKFDDGAIESAVMAQLSRVTIGEDGENVVSEGHVYDVVSVDGVVRILIDMDKASLDDLEELAPLLGGLAGDVAGVKRAIVKPRPAAPQGRKSIPGVGRVLLVHSGKGGVGKSTVTANLAMALSRSGLRVGILDADVYGPSQPVLFGLTGRVEAVETEGAQKIVPREANGIKIMSLGFLLPSEQALVWRGSLVDEGVPQLFFDVDWGELDLLLVDLPPGTSDVHLAIAHRVEVAGVVTVTAPGQTSVHDVMRGMEMFADLAIPCVGVVENMAGLTCPKCDAVSAPFGSDGGRDLADMVGAPLLSVVPFSPELARKSDSGQFESGESGFDGMAGQLWARLSGDKEGTQ